MFLLKTEIVCVCVYVCILSVLGLDCYHLIYSLCFQNKSSFSIETEDMQRDANCCTPGSTLNHAVVVFLHIWCIRVNYTILEINPDIKNPDSNWGNTLVSAFYDSKHKTRMAKKFKFNQFNPSSPFRDYFEWIVNCVNWILNMLIKQETARSWKQTYFLWISAQNSSDTSCFKEPPSTSSCTVFSDLVFYNDDDDNDANMQKETCQVDISLLIISFL